MVVQYSMHGHDGIVPKRNNSETVLSVKGFIPKNLTHTGLQPKVLIPKFWQGQD